MVRIPLPPKKMRDTMGNGQVWLVMNRPENHGSGLCSLLMKKALCPVIRLFPGPCPDNLEGHLSWDSMFQKSFILIDSLSLSSRSTLSV